MSKPRGYRYAELPRDPARLLRALRACRDAMQAAERGVRIGGEFYVAGHVLTTAIDAVAKILTDDKEYFWGRGSSATEAQLDHWKRCDAIERGDEPWPK